MSFQVLTEHPVAVDSFDHITPHGTAADNSRNRKFNERLYALYDRQISVLDLGCSGGGFVKDCLNDGHLAVGIEGSDYSLKRKRAEWATIPEYLFTADITKPFNVAVSATYLGSEHPAPWGESWEVAQFDVVTAWELMEHIPESGLDQLIKNVLGHLKPDGLWIMSVSTNEEHHHVTVRPRQWWLDLFESYGLVNRPELVDHFGDEWIRGPKQLAPGSFHLILGRNQFTESKHANLGYRGPGLHRRAPDEPTEFAERARTAAGNVPGSVPVLAI